MSPNTTNTPAEERLRDLGIDLPHPPAPLGAYIEAVQTGGLLFLSGTLPLEGGIPKFIGRIGGDLSMEDGRRATYLATLNALAAARAHLRSLDRVMRVVRLAVSLVTTQEFREHARVAGAASELLGTVFGADRTSTPMVYGVWSGGSMRRCGTHSRSEDVSSQHSAHFPIYGNQIAEIPL